MRKNLINPDQEKFLEQKRKEQKKEDKEEERIDRGKTSIKPSEQEKKQKELMS